ncbi:hypothetical protein ABT340_15780 [Streptosporangium sp. NPDC000239]|uniref:hypothetical protein n=1 Tax=Streptosporangium sp. NPDC000239 TaxID=3154248 RepID=UPI00332E4D27
MTTPPSTEHGWPFAAGPGQVVSVHDWETMANTWQSSGVVGYPETVANPSDGNRGLFATRISATQIQILPGVATIGGHYFELKLPKVFDLDITGSVWDGSNVRRDLVTLRLDRDNNGFRFVQIKNAIDMVNQVLDLETSEEVPLVQLDVVKNSGLLTEPIDRRWFVGKQVRPIRGSAPFLDPAPYDGEFGVDVANHFLVVGSGGAWVPAAQVFNNDGAYGPSITSLQNRATTLEGKVTTLQTDLDTAEASLATAQAQLAQLPLGTWVDITSFGTGLGSVVGSTIQVRRQGAVVYIRGSLRRTNGTALAAAVRGATVVLTLPAGFFPSTTVALSLAGRNGTTAVYPLSALISTVGQMTILTDSTASNNLLSVDLTGSWMLG